MTDIRKLDPQALLVFDSLLETHSASITAARLGLSQSAVSGALGRLRDIFGDPLFQRHSRGLTPTDRAQELSIPLASAISAQRTLLTSTEFEPETAEGTVAMLATDYALVTVVARLRRHLAKRSPGLRLLARNYSSEEATALSSLASTDFLIGTPTMLPEILKSKLLFRDRLALYMDARHPLADGVSALGDLTGYPHALINLRGRSERGAIDDLLAEAGLERRIDTIVPSFLSLPAFLLGTDRLAIAPARLAGMFGDALVLRDLPVDLPEISLYAAWHKRYAKDGRHAWVRKELSKLAV